MKPTILFSLLLLCAFGVSAQNGPWEFNGSSGGSVPGGTPIAGINAGAAPYNALFNGRSSQDGVLNGTTTVTSATLSCTSADIGKLIFTVNGSRTAKANSTVASCSGASFIMNAAATATESGDNLVICSDDTTALQTAWAAALAASVPLYLPSGLTCVSAQPFQIPASPSSRQPHQAFVLKGAGLTSTVIGMVPSFNFGSATNGAIFENDFILNCAYEVSAIKAFSVVTIEDWSVTGFGFGFPSWPNTGTMWAIYNPCQARRIGIFYILSDSALGMDVPGTEATISDNNIQTIGVAGTGQACLTLGGGSISAFSNIIAFCNIGVTISSCPAGCSLVGGLITNNRGASVNVTGSIVQLADINIQAGSSSSIGVKVDGTSTVDIGRVVLTTSTNGATGISILSGGKVRAQQMDYTVTSGTPTEINNAGTFYDGYGNNLSGSITNTGTWSGDGSITGTALVATNVTPSTGWGTTGAAGNGVSAPVGFTKIIQFTITATGTPGASPTVAVVFPTPFPASVVPVCQLKQIAGTNFTDVTNPVATSGPTATGVTYTFTGTPVAAHTYTLLLSCGNQ